MRTLLEGNRVSRISVRGFAVASATAVTTVGAVVGVAAGSPAAASNDNFEATAADTTLLADIPAGQQAQVQTASLTQQADAQAAAGRAPRRRSPPRRPPVCRPPQDAKAKKDAADKDKADKDAKARDLETRPPAARPRRDASSFAVTELVLGRRGPGDRPADRPRAASSSASATS